MRADDQGDHDSLADSDGLNGQADYFDDLLSHRVDPSRVSQERQAMLRAAEMLMLQGEPARRSRAGNPRPAFERELGAKIFRESAAIGQARAQGAAADTRQKQENEVSRPMSARPRGGPPTPQTAHHQRNASRRGRLPWWMAIPAAAVLLVLGGSVVAAHVAPSSPLFGLHSLEQKVWAQIATDPETRAQRNLDIAQEALSKLEQSIQQHDRVGYRAALDNFENTYTDASQAVEGLKDSNQQPKLQAQLDKLSAQASSDLRNALVGNTFSGMDWSDRLATTKTLKALGNPVLAINKVTYSRGGDPVSNGATGNGAVGNGGAGIGNGMIINVHGAGFAPGAVLLINGKPAGEVRRVLPNELQAVLHGVTTLSAGTNVGVMNPDGTAAELTVNNANTVKQAAPTTTPGNHGGNHGNDSHG